MNIGKVRTVIAIGLVLLMALWLIGTAVGSGNSVYLPTVYKDGGACPTATVPPFPVTAVYVTPDPDCVAPYPTSTPEVYP